MQDDGDDGSSNVIGDDPRMRSQLDDCSSGWVLKV